MISIISNGMKEHIVNVVVDAIVFDCLILLMIIFEELMFIVFSGLNFGSIGGLILAVRGMRGGRRSMVLIMSSFTILGLGFFIASSMTILMVNEDKVSL